MPTPQTRVPRPVRSYPVSRGAGLTHVGLVRERNEDAILTDPTGALWAVADGMGGHGCGDVASDLVVNRLATAPDEGDPADILTNLLMQANDDVKRRAENSRVGVMGATVVALLIEHAVGYVAWAGDSRAYLLRDGRLRMLTKDHTLVQDLVDDGVISAADARDHLDSNIVTRAVGADATLEIDLVTVPFIAGDRVVLCSDGLTGCVGDQSIAALVAAAATPEDACRALVTEALEYGAPDNVSAIVVFLERPEP